MQGIWDTVTVVIVRHGDAQDRRVAVPDEMRWTDEKSANALEVQERYFRTSLVR